MDEVHQPDFTYWTKMPQWTAEEAAALLLGFEPRAVRWLDWREEQEYFALCELAQRCFDAGQVEYSGTPAQWLAWARRVDQPIPAELEAEILESDALGALCGGAGAPTSQQRDILRAISELWPDGNLPGRASDRDKEIHGWFKAKSLTLPSERNIRAALALRK